MGCKWSLADVAPAIDTSEHTSAAKASNLDPVQVSLDRAKLAQRWGSVLAPDVLPISLARPEVKLNPDVALGMRVFDREPGKLVPAEASPESYRQQSDIATRLEKSGHVADGSCLSSLILEMRDCLLKMQQR